uniref:Uncharacterized protein n=2 Tax=Moniliophthora roreri TaxID=221103 RepID=A0A0W0F032_MONRR
MSFDRCSDFTLAAEQVSNVHGSQTNIRHLHGNLVLSPQQTRRERTRWDDTFKQDFNKFTHIRSPYVAQLFGYNNNQSGSLALIFYDVPSNLNTALIPLLHVIFKNNILSPLLYPYFEHQLTLWKPDEKTAIGDLWIDPRSGELRLGPHVQIPLYGSWMLLSYPSNSTFIGQLPPLSIQTYSDMGTTFNYLTRTVPTSNIIQGIVRCYRSFWHKLTDEDAGSIFKTLLGTVFHQPSQKIIARVPVEVRDRIYYYFGRVDTSSDATRKSLDVMEDGSVRFTVMPMDIQCVEEMTVQYFSSLADMKIVWITQAHRVFTQLGIDKDEWNKYSILGRLDLIFKCKRQHPMPHENTSIASGSSGAGPVYLFIQPIPQPSDNNKVWRSWAESTRYFWSSDSFGRKEMSEDMQLSLGLPSFTSKIQAAYPYWDQSAYEAIEMVHHYHHFDLSTTDLASMVGHPILEVVGDDDQFETWKDSTEVTSTSDSRESVDGPTFGTCWDEEDNNNQSWSSEEEDSSMLEDIEEENEVEMELMHIKESDTER